MPDLCPECGATVPEGGSCRDNFDALLLLEWQIPGGPGELAHFYGVATYGLQHPDSMNYTAETLAGLRAGVADVLEGRATVNEIRLRIRRAADGPARVTRRAPEGRVSWRRGGWPVTVADVLGVAVERGAYVGRVTQWAWSVCATLEADQAG